MDQYKGSRLAEGLVHIGQDKADTAKRRDLGFGYPEWSRFILAILGNAREGARLLIRMDDGGGAMTVSPTSLVRGTHQVALARLIR